MKAWLRDKWSNFKADLSRAHRSVTIWVGLVAEAVVEFMPEIARAVTEMENYMLPETYKRIMQGIILVNMLIRFRTTKALRYK